MSPYLYTRLQTLKTYKGEDTQKPLQGDAVMRLAINGYGRVGRCLLRAWHEREDTQSLSMVAINELASDDAIAYLTEYDSTHGRFPANVSYSSNGGVNGHQLLIDETAVDLLQQADHAQLPWQALDIDLVMECTGQIKTAINAQKHIQHKIN